MNDENSTTHVPQKTVGVNGGIGALDRPVGTTCAASAASKSACECNAPAMVMMAGATHVNAALMTTEGWYELTPMSVNHHDKHNHARARGTRMSPRSRIGEIA